MAWTLLEKVRIGQQAILHLELIKFCWSFPVCFSQIIFSVEIVKCLIILYEFCGAVSMHRVFGAIGFTAVSIGRVSSVAPDITKARVSASRIITLIRRKPTIDSCSNNGLKLVRTASQTCVIQLVPAHIILTIYSQFLGHKRLC